MADIRISQATAADIPGLQALSRTIDLFPAEMLPGMLEEGDECTTCWLKAAQGDTVIGLCYARAEPLTDGTWNMLALGVHADAQRTGAGAAMVAGLERQLADGGVRLLIVDTSSGSEFAGARAFYSAQGYRHVATIPDYWSEGDHKVTFAKSLS